MEAQISAFQLVLQSHEARHVLVEATPAKPGSLLEKKELKWKLWGNCLSGSFLDLKLQPYKSCTEVSWKLDQGWWFLHWLAAFAKEPARPKNENGPGKSSKSRRWDGCWNPTCVHGIYLSKVKHVMKKNLICMIVQESIEHIYIYYIYMWTQDIQATWIPSSKLPLPGRTGRDAHRGRHRRGTKYLPPPRGCRGSGRRSATAEANQICDGLQWHPGDFVFFDGEWYFFGCMKRWAGMGSEWLKWSLVIDEAVAL